MHYHLLTGATGLLGAYLLRDAARWGVPLAVVARASRTATGRQRIEDLLARWEKQAGHALARPVVFEGDLSQPGLGLDSSALRWIGDNCQAVIHNAASLTFVTQDRDGEPYRTNVSGTRNLLDLCRQTGIRQFHHVSTAYVCGQRQGRILETELDVGQTMGNDYERSKVEAEKMILDAPHLGSTTFLRPSIIIGDSRTGYVSTFHGFYVPLKIGHGLIDRLPGLETIDIGGLVRLFLLDGDECKNFVPVDWVSAAIMQIVASPELHGRTYHLTPANRVPLLEMAEVMTEVVFQQRGSGNKTPSKGSVSLEFAMSAMQDQLEVYRSYWKDDPEFDRKNTLNALPNLPCPEVNRASLRRTCWYAVRSNFGWPRSPELTPETDVQQLIERVLPRTANVPSRPEYFGLHVSGPGGGQWELAVEQGKVLAHRTGLSRRCRVVAHMNSHTLGAITKQLLSAHDAIRSGRVLLETDGSGPLEGSLEDVAAFFESLHGCCAESHSPTDPGPSPASA